MTRLTLPLVAISAYLLGRFIERAWWMQDRPVREPDKARPLPLDDPRLWSIAPPKTNPTGVTH